VLSINPPYLNVCCFSVVHVVSWKFGLFEVTRVVCPQTASEFQLAGSMELGAQVLQVSLSMKP